MTLAREETPQRSWIRMDCPGIVPPAPRVSEEGIGGRDVGWPRQVHDDEEGLEPTIVLGRD